MSDAERKELEYLRWIYINMDFGPAHEDVLLILNHHYERETGNPVPEGYNLDE